MDKVKYQVHTFGCKVNTYDTGLIQKNLAHHGYESGVENRQEAGRIHVLNTCAVTAEATKEAVRVIRKIKSKDPLATIVVTGCAAQVDTNSFANLPGADLVIANSHKGLLPFLLDQYFKGELKEKVFKSNIFRKDDLEAGGGLEEKHTRAFLKIQDGCNSFCSYCIIPYARGKSRSIPIRDLVMRINELEKDKTTEVVLTGVHIGDFEDSSIVANNKLEDLIEAVLLKTKVKRIRLTSLEPLEVSDRLLSLFQDPRMCRHFHMSIQSAQDQVLRSMKRQYLQHDIIQSLNKIEKILPNSFVGMDVIVGFPNETKEFFEETYKILSEVPWTKLHVFPYSERQGTRAAIMEETIPVRERKDRGAKLRELSLHRYQSEALKQINTIKDVLVLKSGADYVNGLSRDFWPVRLSTSSAGSNLSPGEEVKIQISSFESDYLVGHMAGVAP